MRRAWTALLVLGSSAGLVAAAIACSTGSLDDSPSGETDHPGGAGQPASGPSDSSAPDLEGTGGASTDPTNDEDTVDGGEKDGDTNDKNDRFGSPSRLMPELQLAPLNDGRFVYNPHRAAARRFRGSGHTHAAPDHSQMNPTLQQERLRDLPGSHSHDFAWMTAHNSVIADPRVSGFTHLFGVEIYTKTLPSNAAPHVLALLPDSQLVGKSLPFGLYQYTLIDLPAVIEAAGGLAVFAHPSRYSPTRSEALQVGDALWGMEVVSGNTNPRDNLAFYDARLSAGKYTCASAGNDLHNANYGLTTGDQLVSADSAGAEDLFAAVRACNFFACRTDNPNFTPISEPEVVVDNGAIIARMDHSGTIRFVGNGGSVLKQASGVTNADYTPSPQDSYVRVEMALPTGGAQCYSQPLWLASFGH